MCHIQHNLGIVIIDIDDSMSQRWKMRDIKKLGFGSSVLCHVSMIVEMVTAQIGIYRDGDWHALQALLI